MATFKNNNQKKPGQRTDAFSNYAFGVIGVEIDNVEIAEFTEVSGLEAEVEVYTHEEGGNNLFTHKLPGRVKYPNVVLKRGIAETTDLWDWFHNVMYRKTAETEKKDIGPLSIGRKNITLVLYDQKGARRRVWELTKAYPVKWKGPSFKASDNGISIEEIELVHKGITTGKV
jgi:phage tail-like protein